MPTENASTALANALATWELEFAATDRHTTVHSTDPWEVAVTVVFDCAERTLLVDESLSIVDAETQHSHE